ncbi:MAG: HEAT repeat domain-containing protein [Endomicrobiales bacterium]
MNTKLFTLNIISPAELKPAGIGFSIGSFLLSILFSIIHFTSKILAKGVSLFSPFLLSHIFAGLILAVCVVLPQSLIAADTTRARDTMFAGASISACAAQLNNPSRSIAVSAAKALARMHSNEATQALVGYLGTAKDPYMKIQVIDMIAVDSSKATAQALVGLTQDTNPYVRKAAIRKLGFMPQAQSLPELKRIVTQDSDIGDQKFAVQAMGQHTSTGTVEAADSILSNTNNNPDLRILAVHSLQSINTVEAHKKLKKYVNDTDPAVRNEISKTQGL